MKRIIRGVAMTLATSGLFVHAQAETLEEVYLLAVENDHAYKIAQARFAEGEQTKEIARSALLPSINGGLSWNDRVINRSGVGFNPNEGSFGAFEQEFDTTTTGWEVGLRQTLFDLSIWNTFKSGASQAKLAAAEFRSAEQDIIIRAASAYLDVLRAKDAYETSKAEERAFEQQLEQSRKRFEVGLTAITEVHEAQAAYDSSVANRLITDGQLTIAFEALEVITGKQISQVVPLKEDFPVVPPTPAERKAWVDFAMENNLDLLIQSLASESADYNAKAQKAGHYPTITGDLSYGDSTETDNNLDTDLDSDTASITLTLNVPIYNGGGISARRKQAAQQAIQARENFYLTQRNTVQSARSAHLSVVTSVATVKARQQAITSNQSALDATQSGYEVGTRDLVDVLNAQRNLYEAERVYQDALYSYILFTLSLKEVAGLLEAKDILELDQWLDSQATVDYTY